MRRIIEQRKSKGKQLNQGAYTKDQRAPSAEALVRVYRQEADKQRLLVKKAQVTENRLLFIVSALKTLFQDENFLTLLRAEHLETVPAYVAGRFQSANKA